MNNHEKGESAVEIEKMEAILFIQDQISKDEWCERYFPKVMDFYHQAINQARDQYIEQIKQSL